MLYIYYVCYHRIDEVIDIDSGEPFGKAGGYGIQGEASLFVECIHGDYWNVVSTL
jgi:septum formation protein